MAVQCVCFSFSGGSGLEGWEVPSDVRDTGGVEILDGSTTLGL